MREATLRFAPDILRRLGEELVPHPDLGVIELVRNAYDADATTCVVELLDVDQPGGTVVVTDDGDGMSLDDIISGWLLLGKSPKAEATHSRTLRRKVGEKGLGRLAALRLGRQVTLTTRPRETPGVEHVLKIDWDAFDAVDAVEEVQLNIETSKTECGQGTRIEVTNLVSTFEERDVERLARALVLLTGPFAAPDVFSVRLEAPEFQKLETLVQLKYFDEAEYVIRAFLDENGQASASLHDWRGAELAVGDHFDVSSASPATRGESTMRYFAPAAEFELWTFNLSAESFVVRNSRRKVGEVRAWLKAVGGVHLYHRSLRVHPYGDEGHDWLEMNLRRVRSPEVRPGTNTSVGRIALDDDEQQLKPKTDRMGFLENSAFLELAKFGQNVLDWAASQRLQIREKRRREAKDQAESETKSAWAKVEDTIRALPAPQQRVVREATDRLRQAYDEKVQTVENDLLLYRTLATVGTTAAVFAHETKNPVDLIQVASRALARRARKLLAEVYESELAEQVGTIDDAAESLRTYADIPLRLLHRRKRRAQVVAVNAVIEDLTSMFTPHLELANIRTELQLAGDGPAVRTTVASIEAILANLLANAVYAFTHPHENGTDSRMIVVRTETLDESVVLSVLDNGPGIDTSRMALDEIWLPGRTTREDGTGLGLTIVKDIARDIQGEVHVKARGELGGAEFIIELPRTID
ncbi:ATP-binding protein [Lentzea sp. NPDC060358]|uniref:sensor histidine kinase n=1 Tax=Lentzea sp. NPDC060358 TaxID=3347103 RepID=UPI0036661977